MGLTFGCYGSPKMLRTTEGTQLAGQMQSNRMRGVRVLPTYYVTQALGPTGMLIRGCQPSIELDVVFELG